MSFHKKMIIALVSIVIFCIVAGVVAVNQFKKSDAFKNQVAKTKLLKREHPIDKDIFKADAIYELREMRWSTSTVIEFTPKTAPHVTCVRTNNALSCFDKENH